MTFTFNTTVGELARRSPAAIKVFQRYGVEFCCGGRQRLGQACLAHRLSYERLASEIVAADSTAHRARPGQTERLPT